MLTEIQVRTAKPRDKYYLLHDEKCLYLRVDPTGRKYWILRTWTKGKEHQKSLGPYPDVSLRDARDERDSIRIARRKAGGASTVFLQKHVETFAKAVKEWLHVRIEDRADSYQRTIQFRLQKYILPVLGDMKLDEIAAPHILALCRNIENEGHAETAKRVRVIIGQVFRFAIASGWAEMDPTIALRGALRPKKVKHYATLVTPEDIARLMRAVNAYPYTVMRCALLFSIYTFARPGEVRAAEWREIHDDTWDIPEGKMKMKRRHIVPLSRQALAVLDELHSSTGHGRYLFPSPRNDGRCMSENGVRCALRAMGFGNEEITPHGFRAMFSTVANEQGWNRDVIERQLAHVEEHTVRGAYNHAEYLPERRRLVQWWADWLDEIQK